MLRQVFLRSSFNYDMDEESYLSGLDCPEPTLTQQQFKEESDINTIVDRFGIGYEAPVGLVAPTYMDFEHVFDYQSALNAVREAGEAFMEMSADTRARFNNDPQRFVEFCSKEENRAEAEKLGLVVPKRVEAPPEPLAVRVVPEKAPE